MHDRLTLPRIYPHSSRAATTEAVISRERNSATDKPVRGRGVIKWDDVYEAARNTMSNGCLVLEHVIVTSLAFRSSQ